MGSGGRKQALTPGTVAVHEAILGTLWWTPAQSTDIASPMHVPFACRSFPLHFPFLLFISSRFPSFISPSLPFHVPFIFPSSPRPISRSFPFHFPFIWPNFPAFPPQCSSFPFISLSFIFISLFISPPSFPFISLRFPSFLSVSLHFSPFPFISLRFPSFPRLPLIPLPCDSHVLCFLCWLHFQNEPSRGPYGSILGFDLQPLNPSNHDPFCHWGL